MAERETTDGLWHADGPHGTSNQPYQVVNGDVALCDCWSREDAQRIADALNATEAPNCCDKVRRGLDRLADTRRRLIDCDPIARIAEQAVERFDVARAVEVSELFGDVHILCRVASVSELTELFRWLGRHGYHRCEYSPEPMDLSDSKKRIYHMEPSHLEIHVSLSDDATCQWVQVGEKTEPVYELRCGDGSQADPERVVSKGVEDAEAAARAEGGAA